MPETISLKGPALLRFPHGSHVGVEARLTMNQSIFSVTGEGELVTDDNTVSQALLLDEALSLQIDETIAAYIVMHETRTVRDPAGCRFRVQS